MKSEWEGRSRKAMTRAKLETLKRDEDRGDSWLEVPTT